MRSRNSRRRAFRAKRSGSGGVLFNIDAVQRDAGFGGSELLEHLLHVLAMRAELLEEQQHAVLRRGKAILVVSFGDDLDHNVTPMGFMRFSRHERRFPSVPPPFLENVWEGGVSREGETVRALPESSSPRFILFSSLARVAQLREGFAVEDLKGTPGKVP